MLIKCIREMETLLEVIECLITRLLDNDLAIGVLLGIIVNVVAIALVSWCRRPVLKSPQNDEDWLRDFGITVNDYRGTRVTGKQKVSVWRLKIRNSGRSVADNVRATVLPVFADGSGVERRIAWYEEPRNRLRLNRGDHSYLDVYGVLQGEAKERISGERTQEHHKGYAPGRGEDE